MADSSRPADLGYRWPAEWEPHDATWLAWPHNRETWPGIFEEIPPIFAQLVRLIAEFEPVNVLAGGDDVMTSADHHIGNLDNVTLHDIKTNDAWARDYGPTFLQAPAGKRPALIDWQYNAWGGKYPPWDADNAVPRQIAQQLEYQRFTTGLTLEGGSIDGNGTGTILTTHSCLLDPNRNPTMKRQHVEQYLKAYCCAKKVLWLQGGAIVGDDTDGHIDQLARFAGPTTIVAAIEENTDCANYNPLQHNLQQLKAMTDQTGRAFEVIRLPMPKPVLTDGIRLPASYCNFYIVNGAVIIPQFSDPNDERAVGVLSELFPDRNIIGLEATELVAGLGAFHCLTQQQPSECVLLNTVA